MNKSEIESPSHSPNPLALSVKSHTYYKDSIIADLFEHFCKPTLFSSIIEQGIKKCVVVCSSIKQAKKLHESEYLVWRSVLIQSDEDRRQKIRKNRLFQQNSEIKCLISNHLSNLDFRDIYVNLLVFASPPKNVWIYNETVSKLKQLEYIVVCYNTKQIQDTQLLQKQLKSKFSMLTPPDISSQQSVSEEEQQIKQISKKQETRMGQKTKPSCPVYRSPKPYTPNRVHQKPQQIRSDSSRNVKMTSRNVDQSLRSGNHNYSDYRITAKGKQWNANSFQTRSRKDISYPHQISYPVQINYQNQRRKCSGTNQTYTSHAYDLQIHSKQKQKQTNRRQTTATTSANDGNSDSYSNANSNVYHNYVSISSEGGDKNSNVRYIPSYIDINMAHIEKQRKNKMELALQYQRQMEKKNERIRQQKQRRLSQEKKMIQNLKKMDIIEEDRHRLAQKSYKMQVEQQLSAAKAHRIHDKEIRNREKQQYNKRYGAQTLINSEVEDNTKLNKFKEHYENVNRIQYRIEKNYLDQWSPLIKQQEQQKQKLIQAGIFQAHQFQRNLYPKLQKAEIRHKTELKQALQQQIKQKQAMKSLQKLRYKSEAHMASSYKNLHHPIINPIDFKIAHDNKKILKQLQQEEEMENKISGLARNGSLVVLDHRHQPYN